MNVITIELAKLAAPAWNANEMDASMRTRLRRSIESFGVIAPLVVRRIDEGRYEVVGGSQRLAVLQELRHESAPCVLVEADDAHARLLSQALNHIAGQDNPALRADLLKQVLEELPLERVLELLPETPKTLQSIMAATPETIAARLQQWEAARAVRLKHLTFHLTEDQFQAVHQALDLARRDGAEDESGNPNKRGTALYRICRSYLGDEVPA